MYICREMLLSYPILSYPIRSDPIYLPSYPPTHTPKHRKKITSPISPRLPSNKQAPCFDAPRSETSPLKIKNSPQRSYKKTRYMYSSTHPSCKSTININPPPHTINHANQIISWHSVPARTRIHGRTHSIAGRQAGME